MSTTLLGILIVLVLMLLGAVVWLGLRIARTKPPEGDSQALGFLQNQIGQLQKEMGDRMGETHNAIRQQFSASTNVVRDVTERMSKVEEIARQVLSETNELQKLQQILKNPKQRGILGEYFLETLLKNAMPPDSFQMQYPFPNGEIVDAVVFIKDKIVPIDSKFSLENYNRLSEEQNPAERDRLEKLFVNDLKERVKETAKYIRPENGTMDFAFMFIPHEAIYYDLLINRIGVIGEDTENILQRAASKYRVIIVSPTSFLAYLQTVIQGLRALKIEEQAVEITKRVGELTKHIGAYEQYFTSVGKNLGTVVNQYNLAQKEFGKIDKDVLRITGASNAYEINLIDKPSENE